VEVYIHGLNELGCYFYVVIFTRYNGKWAFCRHRERETYEIPGGRLERGETPPQAAKRELYEETGAEAFTIRAMFDYSVIWDGKPSNGQVYLAEVERIGALPESEIAEVIFLDEMPPDEKMTYPMIQPLLNKKINDILSNEETRAGMKG
jgi:8-oxo-dGTP diphosphatase